MENNELKLERISQIENEIKKLNEKITELESYSDEKVKKLENNVKHSEIIEKIFKVKVDSVQTINAKTKKRRVGRYAGMSNKYKKAIVKLAEGQTIDLG